jgi:hypothetical protein
MATTRRGPHERTGLPAAGGRGKVDRTRETRLPGEAETPRSSDEGHARVSLLWAVTVFVGSGLLFVIQPMIARMLLPRVGGAPSTWTTCVLFFQAVLLAGYVYAHWVANAPREPSSPST